MKPEKKNKRFKPGVIRRSAPFRLPMPIVGPKNGVTLTRKKQNIPPKRRVITYLPPPPPQRPVASNKNLLHIGEYCAPDNYALHLEPPPTAQTPQKGSPRSPLLEAHSDDLTLVGEVDEQVLAFDAEEVKTRYPKIRELAKEVLICHDLSRSP